MVEFILGVIFGMSLITAVSTVIRYYNEYNRYVKPLDIFIKTPLSKWVFHQRLNNFFSVKLNEYIVYGDLDKKEVVVFKDSKAIIISTDLNKKRISHIYNRLVKGFHNEIFVNVTKLNGNTFSNNIMPKDSDGEDVIETFMSPPTIDEILDKISEVGIENLTKEEKDILESFKG